MVERKIDEGTKFIVQLPLEIDLNPVEDKSLKTETVSIENLSILVVEDNEINMEVIEFMLQSEGAIVYKARNGKEAVEQFGQIKNLDLILMDLMMPIMDGYDATLQIRKKDKKRILRILEIYHQTGKNKTQMEKESRKNEVK